MEELRSRMGTMRRPAGSCHHPKTRGKEEKRKWMEILKLRGEGQNTSRPVGSGATGDRQLLSKRPLESEMGRKSPASYQLLPQAEPSNTGTWYTQPSEVTPFSPYQAEQKGPGASRPSPLEQTSSIWKSTWCRSHC